MNRTFFDSKDKSSYQAYVYILILIWRQVYRKALLNVCEFRPIILTVLLMWKGFFSLEFFEYIVKSYYLNLLTYILIFSICFKTKLSIEHLGDEESKTQQTHPVKIVANFLKMSSLLTILKRIWSEKIIKVVIYRCLEKS